VLETGLKLSRDVLRPCLSEMDKIEGLFRTMTRSQGLTVEATDAHFRD